MAQDTSQAEADKTKSITDLMLDVNNSQMNENVIDLYSVGEERHSEEKPFTYKLQLKGSIDGTTTVHALFDGWMMVDAMCSRVFK